MKPRSQNSDLGQNFEYVEITNFDKIIVNLAKYLAQN